MVEQLVIKPITSLDNPGLAKIIREVLIEFGANKPGTVYYDESTDALAELFHKEGSAYFCAFHHGDLVGGAGIYPTMGLPADTCELVKMYLLPSARGTGIAQELISECLRIAMLKGFSAVYLETMPELSRAVKVYERFGFSYLDGPLGNTGHFGCNIWMLKAL